MRTPTSLLVCLLVASAVGAEANDAALVQAERSRGVMTGSQGLQWTVTVTGNQNAKFVATSQNGSVYAEVLSPAEAIGRKYLAESKGTMWFWKPGLSRPVSVSKRQRLSGDAAIGDIASTSFVDGYKLVEKVGGELNGQAVDIYSLKANSLGDTYANIKYWVTKKDSLGIKAEFYSASGKLLRSSTMTYENSIGGRPFLSKMVIKDPSRTVNLAFSGVKLGQFPASMFTRENLGGPSRKIGGGKP